MRFGGVWSGVESANRRLGGVQTDKQEAIAQLSSGRRIQHAGDDVARLSRGVQTSAKIRSQLQVKRNIQEGYSLLQSAQAALSDFRDGMTRMRELSVQAANEATLTNEQRGLLQAEIDQVVEHLHTILKTNQINGQRLIGQDGAQFLDEVLPNGEEVLRDSSVNMLGVIPAGATGVELEMVSGFLDDDLQLFLRDGTHLAGSSITGNPAWSDNGLDLSTIDNALITKENGFDTGATYNGASLFNPPYNLTTPSSTTIGGQTFQFSGEGHPGNYTEKIIIPNVTQDLVVGVVGSAQMLVKATWASMPASGSRTELVESAQLSMEVGVAGTSADRFDVELGNLSVRGLGLDAVIVRSPTESLEGITTIDRAFEKVDALMGQFAANENRLRVSESQAIDTEISLNRDQQITMDADVAEVTAELARATIREQGAQSIIKVQRDIASNFLSLFES